MSIENEKPSTNESTVKSLRSKISKKHIHGFIAGFLAAIILITGTFAAFNPGFLQGTFTKQVGNQALKEEVDLLDVACTPVSLKAATSYDQKIIIDLKKDELKSIKKDDIYLQGLYEGLEVSSVGFEKDKLTVGIKGNPQIKHAYGSDRDNPSGDIYIMSSAVAKDKTMYAAKVKIIYPQLLASTKTLLDKPTYDDTLSFSLSNDDFNGFPKAEDITLSGAFTGMTINNISVNGQDLVFNIKGNKAKNGENGLVTLSNKALKSGFSVDKVVNVAGAVSLFSVSPLTVEESFYETITLNLENDFFAKEVTPEMFTFGEELKDAKISKIERTETDIAIKVTLRGPSLRKTGKGTISLAKEALVSDRPVKGDIYIQNPEIVAVKNTNREINKETDTQILDIYSMGDDFLPQISASDVVLKDAFSGLKVSDVEWLNGYHIKLTTSGKPASGQGLVSIRSAALGGITGAEAKAFETNDIALPDVDIKGVDTNNNEEMQGQTGMWGFDKILDWGIDKVKDLIIDGIKSGAKEGATQGLMYVLRQIGLIGPPVEEMLKEIQTSINNLSTQTRLMEARIIAKLDQLGVQTKIAALLRDETQIEELYKKYIALATEVATFRKNNPNVDPMTKEDLRNWMEKIAGENGDIAKANLNVSILTISNALKGYSGYTSLITDYKTAFKQTLPFEHNYAEALRLFYQEMLLMQTRGLLMYAEYCNYNAAKNPGYYKNELKIFTEQLETNLDIHKTLLPDKNVLNIWNKPLPGDVTVRCNSNNKQYLFTNDAPTVKQMVKYDDPGSGWTKFYSMTDPLIDLFKARWGHIWQDKQRTSLWFLANTPFRQAEKSDIDALFDYRATFYKEMTPKEYLSTFIDHVNGLVDWMFINAGSLSTFWFFFDSRSQDVNFINLTNGSYFTKDSWDLYANYKDYNMKIVLIQRP